MQNHFASEDPKSENLEDILIVDDVLENLRLLSQMLTEHGYRVRAVRNGRHALMAAQAAPPDLILLDVVMPEMDGYEVCRRLKEDERTRDIPILFISALGDVENKLKAFSSGGVDYVTKPFQAPEVLARVRTHLTLRRLNRDLQTANAELARQADELREQNAELDAFAHTVAHDLKGPLGMLFGYATLLAEGWRAFPPEDVTQYLKFVEAGAKKGCDIVEALLLLASTRRQTFIHLQPLDMAQIVKEVQERLRGMIQDRQAEVLVQEHWPVVAGYAAWVEEVWVNYISNAIKYGGVPPRVEIGATEQSDGYVRFWVRDNGPGIPEEKLPRLFVEFDRLDEVRLKEGYGLGLSIVKRILDRLDGQVGVESTMGEGSTFWFTLPLAEQQSTSSDTG